MDPAETCLVALICDTTYSEGCGSDQKMSTEFLCSAAAYYNLAKENSDYPKLPSIPPDMCGEKSTVGSNCKCSDPENFNFVSKKNCDEFNVMMKDMDDDETLKAGPECFMALICDTTTPEGCGFLTNTLSFGLIIFCTLLKL